jgi:hypothetical protein
MYTATVRLLAAILLTGPLIAAAAPPAQRHFAVPNQGSLELSAPSDWKDELRPPQAGRPPTILFTPSSGPTFRIMITAGGVPATGATLPDDTQLHAMVAGAAKDAEAHSVEKVLPVQKLVGLSGNGYYFFATDRAPAPGEWKYLTQGMIRTGGIVLAFTILTNDGQEAVATTALDMLRQAVNVAGGRA